MGAMRNRLVVALLTFALLPAAPAAAAIADSGSTAAPAATAAAKKKKKKCKKGYERKRVRRNGKRVVRCVRKRARAQTPQNPGSGTTPQQPAGGGIADPAATWRSMVSGASFTYSTYNATSGGSSKTVFNFCGDGASFTYYYEFVGSVYNEAKNRNGTYTLNRAEAGTDASGRFVDGLIDYQSNIEERPSGQAVVRVFPDNPGRAFINSGDGPAEFSRTTPSGC